MEVFFPPHIIGKYVLFPQVIGIFHNTTRFSNNKHSKTHVATCAACATNVIWLALNHLFLMKLANTGSESLFMHVAKLQSKVSLMYHNQSASFTSCWTHTAESCPFKTAEEEAAAQEVTVSLAAAKEISTDAAVMVVLSKLSDILWIKEQQKTGRGFFLVITGFGESLVKQSSVTRCSGLCLILPLTPKGSHKLLLSGSTGSKKKILISLLLNVLDRRFVQLPS